LAHRLLENKEKAIDVPTQTDTGVHGEVNGKL